MASAVDSSPEQLTPPLYEAVDPDALDRLFHRQSDEGEHTGSYVVFTWAGCRIVVDDTGATDVSPCDDSPETSGRLVRRGRATNR